MSWYDLVRRGDDFEKGFLLITNKLMDFYSIEMNKIARGKMIITYSDRRLYFWLTNGTRTYFLKFCF